MLVGLSVSLPSFYHKRFDMATCVVGHVILTRCFVESEALIQDDIG